MLYSYSLHVLRDRPIILWLQGTRAVTSEHPVLADAIGRMARIVIVIVNCTSFRSPSRLSSIRVAAISMIWLLAGMFRAHAAAPDGQYVRDWLVAGPLSVEAALVAQVAATLPANLFRPAEGGSLALPSGEQIAWSRYMAPGSIVNLTHVLGQHDKVSALACTTIHVEQAGEVRFRVGSDDQIAILLNRQIVHRYDHPRPLHPDQDEFTAELRAGDNECLAIIGQGRGSWGFTLRLWRGNAIRPPPLTWDAVDVLEQTRELYSPHWRYCVGDDANYAKADFDDSPWQPLSPTGEAADIRDAPVVWFRCPVWVRPSLVGLPCSLRARLHGRLEVYLDGRRTATVGALRLPSGAGSDLSYADSVPFSFHAPHQVLAVRLQRPPELAGQDRLDFRLAVSAVTQAGAEYDARASAQTAAAQAEVSRLREDFAHRSHRDVLRLNRWIIMATLVLFLVFHAALVYYYPRRLANRYFCVTLSLTLAAMIVLHVQEATEDSAVSHALYWTFIGMLPICLLCGLALVHALWCGRVPRRKLIAWAALGAVLYLTGLVQSDRRIAFAILPLMTLEYVRVYLTRALGKLRGAWIYGVGLTCFAAAQAIGVVETVTSAPPPGVDLPYCWVYGFVIWLACVSVDIGREFAGAVRKLEDLTATLDSRVEQVTRQLETSILAQARLETLRYQLNPHFLYNALNSIEAISREEPTHIPEAVWGLSDCLRYALQPKKGGLATLQQELDEVASYLRVEKVRFGERLLVETEVAEDVRQESLPEFSLQSLVENAIKYGMLTSEMPLRVVIRAGRRDGVLEVDVRNTGSWSPAADGVPSGRIGLENLKNRLELLYADRCGLTTHEAAGWVSVIVRIPLTSDEPGGFRGTGDTC